MEEWVEWEVASMEWGIWVEWVEWAEASMEGTVATRGTVATSTTPWVEEWALDGDHITTQFISTDPFVQKSWPFVLGVFKAKHSGRTVGQLLGQGRSTFWFLTL